MSTCSLLVVGCEHRGQHFQSLTEKACWQIGASSPRMQLAQCWLKAAAKWGLCSKLTSAEVQAAELPSLDGNAVSEIPGTMNKSMNGQQQATLHNLRTWFQTICWQPAAHKCPGRDAVETWFLQSLHVVPRTGITASRMGCEHPAEQSWAGTQAEDRGLRKTQQRVLIISMHKSAHKHTGTLH